MCLRRHVHEAVAADTGRAVERVDAWTFHAKRMPSSIRRPMYRITGHYPMAPWRLRGTEISRITDHDAATIRPLLLGIEPCCIGHRVVSWWTEMSAIATVTMMSWCMTISHIRSDRSSGGTTGIPSACGMPEVCLACELQ